MIREASVKDKSNDEKSQKRERRAASLSFWGQIKTKQKAEALD